MNHYEKYYLTFKSLIPLLLSITFLLLDLISLRPLALIYLSYCIYCQLDSKIILIYNESEHMKSIINRCHNTLSQRFRPLFFFPHPIFQTSLAPIDINDIWDSKSSLTSYPHRIPLAETVIDWVASSKESWIDIASDTKRKLLIIIPGLTGSVKDGYIKEICYQALSKDYRPVVYNSRWLTNPVILPQQGYVDPMNDFIITIEFIKKNYPNYKMFAIGTSHGANLMTKYLGIVKDDTPLIGAVSVGNYFDLYTGSKKCGAFWNFTLAKILIMALKKQVKEFQNLPENFKNLEINKALSQKNTTTEEFDEFFTRRLLGYQSIDEYYRKFSCKEVLSNIKKPIMFMQSLDDPICHYSEIPIENTNENLVFYLSKKGGHCAWIQGFFNPTIFFPKPALAFLEALN